MGESVAEGTIVRWLKKVGDAVERDEPLFEISTDKVDAEIPSPSAGVLSEINVKEGETVPINTVVAVIDETAPNRRPPRRSRRKHQPRHHRRSPRLRRTSPLRPCPHLKRTMGVSVPTHPSHPPPPPPHRRHRAALRRDKPRATATATQCTGAHRSRRQRGDAGQAMVCGRSARAAAVAGRAEDRARPSHRRAQHRGQRRGRPSHEGRHPRVHRGGSTRLRGLAGRDEAGPVRGPRTALAPNPVGDCRSRPSRSTNARR